MYWRQQRSMVQNAQREAGSTENPMVSYITLTGLTAKGLDSIADVL
jgi:hypothetical protein